MQPAKPNATNHTTPGSKWHADRLDEDIYTWLSSEAKCVRLSTLHNRTGCATFNDGMHAQLRYVENRTKALSLIRANPTDYPIALTMPLSLLAADILNPATANLSRLSGVILLRDSDSDADLRPPTHLAPGYSAGAASPLHKLRPPSHAFAYAWNAFGSSDFLREYPFAIIAV